MGMHLFQLNISGEALDRFTQEKVLNRKDDVGIASSLHRSVPKTIRKERAADQCAKLHFLRRTATR
jgi:hypothetical protein